MLRNGFGDEVPAHFHSVRRALRITGSVTAEDGYLTYVYAEDESQDRIELYGAAERTYAAAGIDDAVMGFLTALDLSRPERRVPWATN